MGNLDTGGAPLVMPLAVGEVLVLGPVALPEGFTVVFDCRVPSKVQLMRVLLSAVPINIPTPGVQ